HPLPMNNTTQNNSTQLRIWQQNLNTSRTAQLSLLNGPLANNWDILALQEPHINVMKNTSSTKRFHAIYPSTRYSSPDIKSRAVTLISTSLNTNSWTQLPFPSPDIIVIQLVGEFGHCTIFNIYNDG
ncbi:hypothetical protein BU15DRAFT_20990, partial [Melanogaster broomeanus]